MFTVKWVTEDGTEQLQLAKSVTATPFGSKGTFDGPLGPLSAKVTYHRDDGMECSIDTGTVYVMNQEGRTVDRYFLAGVPEAQKAA